MTLNPTQKTRTKDILLLIKNLKSLNLIKLTLLGKFNRRKIRE